MVDIATGLWLDEGMSKTGYDHKTGELHGETICHYCGTLIRIIPEFRPADWHTAARCVEGEEPA